jgi:hypothetical protein
MQTSPAWRALSNTERSLWLSLRLQFNGHNNGLIQATPVVLADDGFTSPATLHKSLRALTVVGFIEQVRQGLMTVGGRKPSLYRFTDEACYENIKHELPAREASHEWKKWKTAAEAEAAIAKAHKDAERPGHFNSNTAKAARGVLKVQKLNRMGSISESETSISDSVGEAWQGTPIQKLNDESEQEIVCKPAPMLTSSVPNADGINAAHRSNSERIYSSATPVPQTPPSVVTAATVPGISPVLLASLVNVRSGNVQ